MRNWIAGALGLALTCAAAAAEGAISELRLGVLMHDSGPFSGSKEHGVDVNAELFFADLGWFSGAWEARPSLGLTVNTEGDTSQVHASLNIGGPIAGPLFVEFGAGVGAHDGEHHTMSPDKKEFGCTFAFHLSSSVGVMVSDNVSLSAYLDHISNGNLCDNNEGMETAGARIGFRF
jgi:hypothetical protein